MSNIEGRPSDQLPDWRDIVDVAESLVGRINVRINWALIQIRDAEIQLDKGNSDAALARLSEAREVLLPVLLATYKNREVG